MMDMTETQSAYCAGIVDGEGTISISANSQQTKIRKDGKKKIVKQISKVIRVSNTDLRLLGWLVDTTGYGKVTKLYQNPNAKYDKFRKGYIKPLYAWSIYGFNIKLFLLEIIPYLLIKKRNAELMLESIEISWHRGNGVGYSPDNWEKQLAIIAEIHKLNKRGIHASI